MFQIVVFFGATFFIAQPYIAKSFDATNSPEAQTNDIYQEIIEHEGGNFLKWDAFNRHCYTPLLYPGNRMSAQLKCDRFGGSAIKWEGTVNNVEIRQVINILEATLSVLPDIVSGPIKCWLGEPNEFMSDVYDSNEMEYFKEQSKCNLNNWNTYEFRIGIKINYSPIKLYLKTRNHFANFTRLLNRSDRIWFQGKLITSYSNPDGGDSIHGSKPTNNLEDHLLWVDVHSIGCIDCKESSLKSFYATNRIKSGSRNIHDGIKYLFNVLFNPLIKIN